MGRQVRGDNAGLSPGFGICLAAETTEGTLYTAECTAERGSQPEELGLVAGNMLLEEIAKGGCVDTTHQSLALTMMALGPEDVYKLRLGKLSACAGAARRTLPAHAAHPPTLCQRARIQRSRRNPHVRTHDAPRRPAQPRDAPTIPAQAHAAAPPLLPAQARAAAPATPAPAPPLLLAQARATAPATPFPTPSPTPFWLHACSIRLPPRLLPAGG